MIIGVDMGHSEYGKNPCGAVGLLNESKENREVGRRLIDKLRSKGHTVIDCSCNSARTVNDQLASIVNKANSQKLDVFISLHLNAGGGTGAEVYTTSNSSAKDIAKRVLNTYVDATGFKNRGHKFSNLYVLRHTVAPSLLLELCFVDSNDDKRRWDNLSYDNIVNSIARGLTNEKYNNEKIEIIEEDDFMSIKDTFVERYYLDSNPDVAASGMNPREHYDKYGKEEGRKPNCGVPEDWSEGGYLMNNPDVDRNVSSGNGYKNGLEHYLYNGYREGRTWVYNHTCKIEDVKQEIEENGEKFYRVCTGSYKEINNARTQKDVLKEKGVNDAFIVEYYKK